MVGGKYIYAFVICVSILLGICICQDVEDHNCEYPSKNIYDVSGTGTSVINVTERSVICVNVSDNNIAKLTNDIFSQLWNVKSLDLSHNHLTELPPLLLNSLRTLEFLYVTHNRLTSLPVDLFKNSLQLRMVNFSHNQINKIPLPVFNYSLGNLGVVDLTNNALTSYEPWNYVNKGTNRRKLDLRWNNISSFTNDFNLVINKIDFYVFAYIETDMRHNSFHYWSDASIKQYFHQSDVSIEDPLSLLVFDFRDNPWICDCHMYMLSSRLWDSFYKWHKNKYLLVNCHGPPELRGKRILYDLHLEDFVCNITQNCPDRCLCQDRPHQQLISVDCRNKDLERIPETVPYSPYGKIILQLDGNKITSLANFSYSKQVVQLSISRNYLTFIDDGIIEDIASWDNAVSMLDLSTNRLKSLPDSIQKMKYQNTLISGNMLECSCDMLWMVDWIKIAPKFADKTITCNYKDEAYRVIELNEDLLDCHNVRGLILIIVLSSIMVIVIVLLVTAKRCPYETKVLFYKIFRIHPLDKYRVDELERDYDMYVSFDEEDPYVRQWVRKVLVRQLETKKPFYRLGISFRNLKSGSEAEARLDLMEESKRLLIILSGGYERNRWCQYESTQSECMEDIDGRVIYLLYDNHAVSLARSEPWKSRISGRKCFTVGTRMLWSKLRYELPVKPSQMRSHF